MNDLTIGQLARKCGVRTDTIRYYEQLEIIQPEDRSSAGYRLYGPESIRTIKFIRRAKDLGFTLAEIKILLNLKASQTATCRDMLERTEAKIVEAKENMRHLNNMHDVLEKLSEACPGGNMPLSECPILDHLYPEN
ncbi:MAG: heavy metal-responsive transcriptional regulator [Emcibacter sp.]|nr:heavy metal-responsive transcriptional regulator [Emcibacter sp.]